MVLAIAFIVMLPLYRLISKRILYNRSQRQWPTRVLKGLLEVEFEVLNRTSSHMWDNWNFLMFLLREGSLTLMYGLSDGSSDVVYLPIHN